MSALAIETKSLVVRYGHKTAVDGLDLQVPQGTVFGFLGPNGSGKTTTIKTLLGFRAPDGGSAQVLGLDVVRESLALRARVGYVSEVNSLYDYLSAEGLCSFCQATNPRWQQDIADRYLKAFNLPPGVKVGRFSKGMKSQLAFALAMGNDPDLLILDEPTTGLDPIARRELLNRLVSEVVAQGKTVFFSSHILAEVEAVADWVGIIAWGKLLVSDSLDHLRQGHKALRLTYEVTPPPSERAWLSQLPAVISVEQEGRSVRLLLHDSHETVVAAVRERGLALRDSEIVDQSLEDIFLLYVRDKNLAS